MKKRLPAIIISLILSLSLLSSCLYIDGSGLLDAGTKNNGNTNINVTGGDNYNVSITNPVPSNVAGAGKALLSSVSVYTSSSAGSGVIYKLDKEKGNAYIITNFHVVYNNSTGDIDSQIYVYLYGMEASEYGIRATYLGGSINYDLALLKVETSQILMESIAAEVSIADSDKVAILDTAIAIGNPEGSGISATVGCINVDSELITVLFTTNKGRYQYQVSLRVMRTDAAVNSGNSGGGLFNEKGELMGIVNAKNADSSTDNIGYAIPSNVAKAVADNIIYYCDGETKITPYRCLLGITVGVDELVPDYDVETGKIYKNETVVISSIETGSAVNGLLKVGDVINSLTIDGILREVKRTHHIVDHMLYARVGSTVVVNVTRDGTTMDITIPATQDMILSADANYKY